ncbi:MAG: hypothetical protein JSW14_07865 [Candidatus Bathyarchaeum sp.]|nr:MAG: hypothetical protein JSW14_07865 [Candidatus Bathyarchaeum sp.]
MLADTPMTFSEILESLTIDSGHFNYHLESLGDLVLHTKDGKYLLSSFGDAAVLLMSGVEELPVPASSHKHKISQVMPKVFSLILAIILVATSIHFVTYAIPTSISTLNPDKIYPTPFVIDAGQTFDFNATLEYWRYPAWLVGPPLFSRALYAGPFGPDAYTFEVQPAPNTFTAQAGGSIWLDFRLNTTSRKSNALVLMPFGFPNDLVIDVYTPTGTKSLGKLEWTYGKIDHFTSPIVEVNQLGTYRFVIKNNDSNEWTGILTPKVEWQLMEKPYFYYGATGLIISIGCFAFILYNLLGKSKKVALPYSASTAAPSN